MAAALALSCAAVFRDTLALMFEVCVILAADKRRVVHFPGGRLCLDALNPHA